ncbi:uncharacterized protein LOC122036115 isoform X2 [Zingiber officinale]|uniref:Uncharacterized protein n=1 Tax=Zingiber officinale TaxID=94328 RepID=A0A8J5C109_ZINOF|nr:uncharacterized protein LOC122036115 isoform X2 [Zingiber officinale]KAG6466558.1 hypothetical protein ZIOFF_075646 [Zingiber officinale]
MLYRSMVALLTSVSGQNNKEDCVDTSMPELDANTLRLEETKRARELTSLFSFVFFFQILGAATTCYVALHPNLRSVTGKYFDEELSRRLWYLNEKMIKANE